MQSTAFDDAVDGRIDIKFLDEEICAPLNVKYMSVIDLVIKVASKLGQIGVYRR